MKRERQLIVDFLCASSGGPLYYKGRDMKLSHKGMRISESDWTIFLNHADATFDLPLLERNRRLAASASDHTVCTTYPTLSVARPICC